MMTYVLFFLANIVAGAVNALGGGGLITFPLLMLVVAPVTADATSAVALLSGYPTAVWRTRDQLAGVVRRGWFWLLLVTTLLGGLIGALLLSRTGNRNFIQLVPWLVLGATIVITLRPLIVRYTGGHRIHPTFAAAWWPVAIASIFAVALYGGYIGGMLSHRANRVVIRSIAIAIGFAVVGTTSGNCTGHPRCGLEANRRGKDVTGRTSDGWTDGAALRHQRCRLQQAFF
jgi:uncharacterized membrane protein YfcA